ncbi:MAG: STAS domain-containing protein [Nocardioidaceae bacterium]|nr:STAS domain-containing protein [Nocardioidaceae bacterium]
MRRVRVVRLRGEFDITSAAALATALAADASGPPLTVVDLAAADFIDCATVHVLQAEARRLKSRGGGLEVAAAHDGVERLLALVGFRNGSQVYGTVEQAVAALSAARRGSRAASYPD